MNQFERETPYVVLSAKDLTAVGLTEAELDSLAAISAKVDQYRLDSCKHYLECVVVEKGWPEYEPTWLAIEHRLAGDASSCQAPSS